MGNDITDDGVNHVGSSALLAKPASTGSLTASPWAQHSNLPGEASDDLMSPISDALSAPAVPEELATLPADFSPLLGNAG